MNKTLWVHAALFLANLLYGANFTIAKEIMPSYILPFGFIFWRVAISLVLYFAVWYYFVREKIERKDIFQFILCGLFGVTANQLLFFKGLAITTPINASLIMVATPIFVFLIAIFSIRESISFSKIAGIISGAVGAAIIVLFGHDFSFGSATLRGDFFIFINAISYAVFLVLVKPLMRKYQPVTVIMQSFLFGFLLVIPFGIQEALAVQWNTFSFSVWLCFFYVVIATTFIAYLLNTVALKTADASLAGIYIYAQPVVATAIAVGFGKDELTWLKIIASLLIFAGVYLVSKPQGKN